MMYVPSNEILEKYADVIINFALGNGKGIKKGDVVRVQIQESAKPFYNPLQKAVLKAGGNPMMQYMPDGIDAPYGGNKCFYENASQEQLSFFSKNFVDGKVATIDHSIRVVSDSDMHALDGVSPEKIIEKRKAVKYFKDIRDKKEREGKFSRTICMYGTEAMAKEAGLSPEEYRNQIISACFLDEEDPVQKWKYIQTRINEIINKLNQLSLEYVHVIGPDEDLKLKIGQNRCRRGGTGCNIPSFEIFTSPDCRDVNGWIKCNQPLYRYGNLIEGIELEFKDGKLTQAHAEKNNQILQEMIKIEGMNQLGEFSLTDASMSRITNFMAETLYDENVGGEFGNTHIALGMSFDDCYRGYVKDLNDEKFKKSVGLNISAEHVDVISTANRKVIGTLQNGDEILIYEDGHFVI